MDDYFAGSAAVRPGPVAPPSAPGPFPHQQPLGWSVPQAPSTGMPTGVKVLIGVAVGFGGFVVLGILAAIAIPVFLHQRALDQARRTTVDIPAVAAGLPLRTDAVGDGYAARLRALPLPGTHLAGAYGGGAGRPEALVGVTRAAMTPTDERQYIAGSTAGATRVSGGGVTFADLDPGSWGGRLSCSSGAAMTVCFFADAGAYGSVVVWDGQDRAMQLVPQLRAGVEHRS